MDSAMNDRIVARTIRLKVLPFSWDGIHEDPDIGMLSPRAMTNRGRQSTFDRRILSITMTVFALAALLIAVA
jgi:hypothetical protein